MRIVTEQVGVVMYEGPERKHSYPRGCPHDQLNLEDMLRLRLQTRVWRQPMTEDERKMRKWATCKADYTRHSTENGVLYCSYYTLAEVQKFWSSHKRAQKLHYDSKKL